MGRFWSLLFLAAAVASVLTFAVAPYYNIWLPPDDSEHGHEIDHQWYLILWLTGVVFVGTEVALFWFMWKYDKDKNKEPVKFTHGNHQLEIIWSILPAATLVFIAFYQIKAWADVKMDQPQVPPTVEVLARQFEWRIRYPGADGVLGTEDDIHTVNDLHVPVDEMVMVHLKSADVLHSFFLPNMRVKQDAVPGHTIPVWFRPTKEDTYDLVCAELCGWGHYKMKGRLTVESREKFDAWLKQLAEEQEKMQ